MSRHRAATVVAAAVGFILAIGLQRPAVSAVAESGVIAFETPSGIHLISTDGSGLQRLPGTRPGNQNPRWSPDGTEIAFWTDASGEDEIYVAAADGSQRRRLTPQPARVGSQSPSGGFPAWSPDGRSIAFEGSINTTHIWVMRPDGSRARRITPDEWGGYEPDWSPDGKRVVYTPWGPPTIEIVTLAIVDLAGRARSVNTYWDSAGWSPAWSPDGSRIAFASERHHGKPEIYVVGVRGGEPRRLTDNDVADSNPRWSPDGTHILFTTGRTGFDEIYVMRADGSEQRRVTRIPNEYACCADWKP